MIGSGGLLDAPLLVPQILAVGDISRPEEGAAYAAPFCTLRTR
jgi:hypothetical protein